MEKNCEGIYSSKQSTDKVQQLRIENTGQEDPNLPPLKSEVEWAIKFLKDRKSPGCDSIQAEMIKASGEKGIEVYHNLCSKI